MKLGVLAQLREGYPSLLRFEYSSIAFALVLIFYTAFAIHAAPTELVNDENGYMSIAESILHGDYFTSDRVDLWWGPGYPLILSVFLGLHLPLIIARLANVGFLAGSIIFLYRTIRMYSPRWVGIASAAYFALTLALIYSLPFLLTECLTVFLLSIWTFAFCRALTSTFSLLWLVVAAFDLAYLGMTKIFFGYVILSGLVISFGLLLWRWRTYKRWFAMYALCLAFSTPYLAYTFSLTGHFLYWGSSGGLSLYWMATPYPDELGDWHNSTPEGLAGLAPEHSEFLASLAYLQQVERDDALRSRAIKNIETHPGKFMQNWIANIGRMLMDWPYSFVPFRSANVFRLAISLSALAFCGLGLRSLISRRNDRCELLGVAQLLLVALLGSSLVSAYPRQFAVMIPLMLVVGSASMCREAGERGSRAARV